MGEGDAQVAEGEHAVERLDEELNLGLLAATVVVMIDGWETHQEVANKKEDKAAVVGGIRSL